MWHIVRRMERGNWWPPRSFGRFSATGTFAVATLLVILATGWLVDRHAASANDQRLAELARNADQPPVDLVVRAARANRMLFLSDIHNSNATKELAAQAIARIGATSGLDAVVVEVGADQQPYIDAYLDRTPEDASILLSHPRTIGEPGAATRAYLDVYRTVWKLNQKLGPDERIRIIAADLPGWPPTAPSPTETARKLAEREAYMQKTLDDEILSAIPDARVLFFVTGFHALKAVTVTVESGGAAPITVEPLAARLAGITSEVYTILVDAASAGVTGQQLVSYSGTRIAQVLDDAGVRRRFATPVTRAFDYLRSPVIEATAPGIEYSIGPRGYKLGDVADAYISLGH